MSGLLAQEARNNRELIGLSISLPWAWEGLKRQSLPGSSWRQRSCACPVHSAFLQVPVFVQWLGWLRLELYCLVLLLGVCLHVKGTLQKVTFQTQHPTASAHSAAQRSPQHSPPLKRSLLAVHRSPSL